MNLLDRISLDRMSYDSGGYTVQEILSSFSKKILEIIDLVNKNEEVCDEAHTIVENIRNELVPPIVEDIIKELQDNGYFDRLVNVTLINQLRTELTTLLNQTITDYTTKLNNIQSELETKVNQDDLTPVITSLDLMRENVFEANSKFTRVSNFFADVIQEQDINDMRCRIDVDNCLCGVIFKFNNEKDLIFQIRKPSINPNRLPSPFGALLYNPNTGDYPIAWDGTNRGVLYSATTDWLGPMIVEAINNGDGTTDKKFTGGFHGDTGGLTGNPTARNVSYKILVDGVEQTTNINDMKCKKVEFISINRLYGYNTTSLNREVVEETHHMIMKAKKGKLLFEVFTEIKALEDVKIHTYYGLQTHSPSNNNLWAESIHFVGGQQKNRVIVDKDMDSGKRGDYLCTRIVQRSSTNGYDLMSWIDSGYGLGTMSNCNIDQPCVKIINSTKKTYFNLVMGDGEYSTPLILKANEKVFWHGGYTLNASNTNNNVVDCELTKLENDRFVKVIDFTKQGNAQTPINGKYAGKVINLVGGIGFNKFIYNGNLNITSPGYGSIEILE